MSNVNNKEGYNNHDIKNDFTKEFIETQLDIKQYLKDNECFTLMDIIHDPLVIHSLENYYQAYKEERDVSKIKKILKNLYKMKKQNVDIHEVLTKINLKSTVIKATNPSKYNVISDDSDKFVFFPMIDKPSGEKYTKEKATAEFMSHINKLASKTKLSLQVPNFARNLNISSSHSNLIKKIEKTGDNAIVKEFVDKKRDSNEITSSSLFRNGVLKQSNNNTGFSQYLNKKDSFSNGEQNELYKNESKKDGE